MTITDSAVDTNLDANKDASLLGKRLLRKEDPELLTGEARFVDDLDLTGALWAACVRSPHAHARIKSVNFAEALAAEGVLAAYSGADLAESWGPLPCAWPVTEDMKNPAHLPVAVDKVNYVGDVVAVVLAKDRYLAADAAAMVDVEYEPLTAVVDLEESLSDKTVIHEDLETNASYTWELTSDADAVEAAFASATHVVKQRYIQQRLIPAAMEPRGVVAVPAPFGGDITIYSATQIPHILKVMVALTLGLPEQKVRVIAPCVGGGFGSKLNVYAEEVICTALALRHSLAVRWTESRSEAAASTVQGRGQIQDIELAADAEGRISGVRVKLLADMGAYLQLVTPGVPLLGAFLYHGCYDIPNYSFVCTGLFTNLTPTDAYRGAGRPEATYAIERAIDALAAEVGVDPAEIRRRNFIAPEQFPYDSAAGLTFDSGDYPQALTKAMELVDYQSLRSQQAQRRAEADTSNLGPQIGIGLSSYVEMCGLAPSRVLASLNYAAGGWESATVRVLPTAKVQVVTGTTPHGQGHETCWSMIVADKLGVDPEDVEVLHSDTAISPLGLDTYGSRSLSVGGTAVYMAADKVIEKARQIAAHQMEANAEDLEFTQGTFRVKGQPDAEMPLAAVAFEAFTAHNLPDGLEPNLEGHVTWDPPNFTFPFGTHVAVVEVDPETGNVELLDYVAVDDCGNQVNPLVVEGQVHGGILQGAAQALWEGVVCDDQGQPRNSSFLDYLVPSSAETPSFRTDCTTTPSPTNPMGVKGIGEAGTIAATPAVMNAIVDALSPFGISDVEMPASPERIWELIKR